MSQTENQLFTKMKEIMDLAQNANMNNSQIQKLVLDIQKELQDYKQKFDTTTDSTKREMHEITTEMKAFANTITYNTQDIENIAGVRTPKWYSVTVGFDYDDSSLKFSSIEINSEGPFIITQITPIWRIQDPNREHFARGSSGTPYQGRTLPCTAYPFLNNVLGITTQNTAGSNTGYNTPSFTQLVTRFSGFNAWGVLSDIPEFDFQIEVVGTGKFFTAQPIPAATFYGNKQQPLFTGIQGWADRGDRLVIHCTPIVPVPHKGQVEFIIHGYQILGDFKIEEVLQYDNQ